jgi:hypothetical protein
LTINKRQRRILWAALLGVSLLLSILAALRGGYVGPDFNTHMAQVIAWEKVFDLSAQSPPTYYLLAHGLFRLVGSNKWFPITLSIIQSIMNATARWWFFLFCERRFKSALVHTSLVLFLTFLPVRIIHAAVIGTDCLTIPVFVLVLFLCDKALTQATPRNALLLGLGLSLGLCAKYSFMGLLPAVFLILICIGRRRGWSFKCFAMMCALSLLLPSALTMASLWASSRLHGFNTEKHWLPKGVVADMNYRDLFSVKSNDLQLFKAPEYFKKEILTAHKHSYLGLSHMGIFTDTMNLFQELTVPQRLEPGLIPDLKTRRPWKTPVMQVSMYLGTSWTLLALIGTPWILMRALRNRRNAGLEREEFTVFLGVAYFLLMFLPIPFVYFGDFFGYWTPRLILPPLLCFSLAAFLLIDRKIAVKSNQIALTVLILATVQCAVEVVMLT